MPVEATRTSRIWAAGDLNAFFGLALDNLTNLVLLSGILTAGFGFPPDVIMKRMIPGTALGVLVGDLVYTWLAVRLARRTGKPGVTAMPLGLDTPSTIGMAVAVIGPVYVASGSAEAAWQVGAATLVVMGLVKTALSFCGDRIRRLFPDASLLGSIAGVGIALLGFIPMVEIYGTPLAGMVSLGIVLATLVARIDLPGRLPGAFVAIAAGTVVYYAAGAAGVPGPVVEAPDFGLALTPALPTGAWIAGLPGALAYLPISVPFGLLTIVGGINVTQSARLAGDEYETRDVPLTEAAATLVAGLFGGVAQTTPYIGHPAYKAMGARAGYTLLTAIVVGLGGMLGMVSFLVDLLPAAAVVPVLVFVGLEIVSQAYRVCPDRHAPAITIAFLPVIAYLVLIYMDQFAGAIGGMAAAVGEKAPELAGLVVVPERLAGTHATVRKLGNGFIVTSMIWSAAAALIADRRPARAAIFLAAAAVMTPFGLIHSVRPTGEVYLPWAAGSPAPLVLAAAYAATALVLVLIGAVARPVPAGGDGKNP